MTPDVAGSQFEDREYASNIGLDSVNDSDDDNREDVANKETYAPTNIQGLIASLDDEALFKGFKKLVCNSIRKIVCDAAASSNVSNTAAHSSFGVGNPNQATAAATKVVPRASQSFSDVIASLSPAKRSVIDTYGFGSLLLFEKCPIPTSFSRWVVEHVQVNILLKGRSITITPQIVHDILDIPIGGKTILKSNNTESGKLGLLDSGFEIFANR